jgi:hypothetical protein
MSAVFATMNGVYSDSAVAAALRLLDQGMTVSAVSRSTGVIRATLRSWRDEPRSPRRSECFRCEARTVDENAYAELLGYYLGDGCLSKAKRFYAFRVSCDAKYPGIIANVGALMSRVRPGIRVFEVRAPGAVVVQSHWQHWPCLFPQHGPGRKHERPIRLEPWQWEIVEAVPAHLLRGLFHSDGSRTNNWAMQLVAGTRKRYDYPRWEFSNRSEGHHADLHLRA